MFNVTIINVKGSIKKIAILIIVLIILFGITKIVKNLQTSEILQINISEKLITCLNKEIPAIANTYIKANTTIKEDGEEIEDNIIARILGIELSQIKETIATEKNEEINQEENNAEDPKRENEEGNKAENNPQDLDVQTNISTQIVTKNPISESYNVEISGVKIKNETSFEIDESIISNPLDVDKNNVLIFHTHTCESYTPSEMYPYEQTGNFRTTDLNYSVSRVGDELTNYLQGFGFNTIHDKTYHDYPAYTGSYTRSLATVQKNLKVTSSDIILDLHRDAIGSKSDYDPSVQIGEDVASQLMFVIGTNGGGLYHPNWKSNLQFAIELQKKANEMYPGLFKPIILRNSRYNQHLGKAACIIEVGSTGNTLEQSLNSMKYLSKVMETLLK